MAPSSFSHDTEIKHDLFISFRGPDIRRGLLSFLKKELRRRQIDLYVDDEKLEKGDEISSALLRAIEGSQISLVIFSKDYAYSKWCLEELAKMIECMEINKQIVLPVFYNVDPADVRHQRGLYGDALAKHEDKYKESMVNLQKWRLALEKAAQLSGFHYPTNYEDESDLIDDIVEDVLEKLSKFCPIESSTLVGIDQNIARIESLLIMESKEVQILGIWGMGGIGKTTIAHAVFDKFSLQYDGCSFLENVREENENNQLSYLREKLQSELLEEEHLCTNGTSKARFFSSVKRRLSRKKVFIVLDDVNTSEQLKYLVGEPICFGPGSRVIVTSRDKQVLSSGGVHEIYEVKELNFQDSLKLFCLNAFNESQPKMGFEALSKKAVAYANGIPLALEVLGSDFHSKSKDAWESALSKLKKYPNKKILSALRFSYDGLDVVEKKVFLDVAFFFKEEDQGYVIRQLDVWGFYGACGIEALQQKALITISNDNRIQMHDLIQEMGWEIVCEESSRYPGRRSRLRDNDEVYDVLKNNRGTDAVEGMQIDVSQIRDLSLSVDTFKKMPKLRFLKFYCPLHVELSMPPSLVKELLRGVQDFLNVKRTNLSRSKLLAEELQFPKASILECANPKYCLSLHDLVNLKTNDVGRYKQVIEVDDGSNTSNLDGVLECETMNDGHPSILSQQTQVALVQSRCKEFMSIGSEIHIKSLDYVLIDGYACPKEFSESLMELRQPNLTHTGLEILNSSIGLVNNLDCSDIDCHDRNLPDELFCLRSTSYLRLSKTRGQDTGKPKLHILFDGLRYSRRISLNELHNSLELAVPGKSSVFSRLCVLRLDGIILERLPTTIKLLLGLKELSLRGLRWLQSLLEIPPSIEFLHVHDCKKLETIVDFRLTIAGPPEHHHGSILLHKCVSLNAEQMVYSWDQIQRALRTWWQITKNKNKSISYEIVIV